MRREGCREIRDRGFPSSDVCFPHPFSHSFLSLFVVLGILSLTRQLCCITFISAAGLAPSYSSSLIHPLPFRQKVTEIYGNNAFHYPNQRSCSRWHRPLRYVPAIPTSYLIMLAKLTKPLQFPSSSPAKPRPASSSAAPPSQPKSQTL